MSDIPTAFAAETRRITAQDIDTNSQAAWQQLADSGYEIHLGLTPNYAEQILKMSQEPAIREYCPKDSAERFPNQAAVEQWLEKGRAVFLLLKEGDLIGYGWTGTATSLQVPEGHTTFALRIGEIGHGQGLAAPFSWLTISASNTLFGLKDFWLETWASNGAAVHIYHKLGFEDVSKISAQRPTVDDQTVDDTRIYMKLPAKFLVN
jgi:hypothetical protein